ncbi:glycosyltransferase family 2 protein [Candidatus Roizmanbacteria bacterium]|nr:glycosyltransferase family 2 protein [Candidatus Roizmanbacteria bacterium]
MLLSIVTLNYKKAKLTLGCIASLMDKFKKEFQEGELELIVVDNASSDDSVQILQNEVKDKKYKNVSILANQENFGFGKGNNLGADVAKGEYILFLNNDTQVLDKGILDMVNYMDQHKDVSILGGQLRNSDGTLQVSVGKFYTLFNAFLLLLGMQKFGLLDKSPDKITEVDWVKGGLLMIRKDVFRRLGGFDEKIFMYTEDMELCYRARMLSYCVLFYPDVMVIHAEHGSANRSFAIINIYRGLLYFYKKHRSYLEYAILKTLLVIKALVAISIGTITGNSYLSKTYKKALSF